MWSLLVLSLLAQLFANISCDGVNTSDKVKVDNSTEIKGLWELETPFGVQLSAVYKGSLAYTTIKERTPSILSKLVDSLNRDKVEITQRYGGNSLDELQYFIDSIIELKNEIITNQPLTPLVLTQYDSGGDVEIWNNYLTLRREVEGSNLSWFFTRFLVAECYAYRRIAQTLRATDNLRGFDYFQKQKQALFTNSIDSIKILARHTVQRLSKSLNDSMYEPKRELANFLKLSMWANRFDLALNTGELNATGNPIDLLNSFDTDLLIDDTDVVWNILMNPNKTDNLVIVDIVLDNAGYELFSDLCLASFLVGHGIAHKVRFHFKQIPWFVSDVNKLDFEWMIEYMRTSTDPDLKRFGDLCMQHIRQGTWIFETTSFWTTFYDYGQMKKQNNDLYRSLSNAALVIFKGDLNYRKLMGDINWDHSTTLDAVLSQRDFRPTSIVALRTVKSQICVGLDDDKVRLWKKDRELMGSGKYGVINAMVYSPCVCTDNT